jgi:cytochrome c55X
MVKTAFACIMAMVISGAALSDVGAPRQAELLYLLKHDCGSCHGMTRKGGLGSPLRAEALLGSSDETLVDIILDGVPGTPMPPWRPLLSLEEATWLVRALRDGRVAR